MTIIKTICKAYLLTILLASCSLNQTANSDNNDLSEALSNYNPDKFVSSFEKIDPNNLHVYTPCDKKDGKRFEGKIIDRTFYRFFSFNAEYTELMNYFLKDSSYYHIYSSYQFPISSDKLGLLVRWPSQYDESAIYLFTWDIDSQQITQGVKLTDSFGDEGWHFVQDAWLKDLNNDHQTDIVTRRKDYDQDLDDTTKLPTTTDSLFVYIGSGREYKKTKILVDTNQFQILNWTGEE